MVRHGTLERLKIKGHQTSVARVIRSTLMYTFPKITSFTAFITVIVITNYIHVFPFTKLFLY